MTDVAQTQIARFEHDYQSGKLGHYHPGEMTHAVNKLKEIYRAGVISSEDMNKVQQDEYTQVQIVVGTTSTLRETRLLLTKNSAREYLLSDKSQPLDNTLVSHIDNYININLSLNKEKSEASLQEALNEITPIAYLKPAGAKIIDRGEIVNSICATTIRRTSCCSTWGVWDSSSPSSAQWCSISVFLDTPICLRLTRFISFSLSSRCSASLLPLRRAPISCPSMPFPLLWCPLYCASSQTPERLSLRTSQR